MIFSRRLFSPTLILLFAAVVFATGCVFAQNDTAAKGNPDLHAIFDDYYEAWLVLNPMEATGLGVHDYDHLLAVDISESHRNTVRVLSVETLAALDQFNDAALTVQLYLCA